MSIESITRNHNAEQIAKQLGKYKRAGDWIMVQCPCHDDRNPSLALKDGDLRLIVRCHAGCREQDIFDELRRRDLLSIESPRASTQNVTYEYHDAHGRLLFRKVRTPDKKFILQEWSGSAWVNGIKNVKERPLFNLPAVLKAQAAKQTIAITEGEKDARNLQEFIGITTCCNFDGAATKGQRSKWRAEYSESLKDVDVLVFYDNDEAGHAHRDAVVSALKGIARSVSIVHLPSELNQRPVKDISDWISAGGTPEQLTQLISESRPTQTSVLVVDDLANFLSLEIPPREMLVAPFLYEQSLSMLYAVRGVGKTFFGLSLALAGAIGGSFLNYRAARPFKVTYIDGEMPVSSFQDRLRALLPGFGASYQPGFLKIVTPDRQTGAMPDLATEAGQRIVDEIMEDSKLIIIDNLSCLVRSGGPENDAESWLSVQSWALAKRKEGRAVLFVHHANKTGGQRGTSKKEDLLDTVICLRRPEGYTPAHGATFVVHYEKARNLHGEASEPFQAQLVKAHSKVPGQNMISHLEWRLATVDQDSLEKVADLANQGWTQAAICSKLQLSKGTLYRLMNQAKENGLIRRRKKRDPDLEE